MDDQQQGGRILDQDYSLSRVDIVRNVALDDWRRIHWLAGWFCQSSGERGYSNGGERCTFLLAFGGDEGLFGLLADLQLHILAARLVSGGRLWVVFVIVILML